MRTWFLRFAVCSVQASTQNYNTTKPQNHTTNVCCLERRADLLNQQHCHRQRRTGLRLELQPPFASYLCVHLLNVSAQLFDHIVEILPRELVQLQVIFRITANRQHAYGASAPLSERNWQGS